MKRMAILTDNPGDGTSFYRAFGPWSKLRDIVDIVLIPEFSWVAMSSVDAIFAHRPFTQTHKRIITMAKTMGKKVWVDFDDDITAVPYDNPTFMTYLNCQETVAGCTAMADVVTVSTNALKFKYKKWNQNIRVIPNAFDDSLYPQRPPVKKNPDQVSILWRGSSTHTRDLMTYAQPIINILKDTPNAHAYFFGAIPWFIIEKIGQNQVTFLPGCDLLEYFGTIFQLEPDIMIVPLHDNEFNRAKSNIAWIEGTMAGAAVLAPDFPEWSMCDWKYNGTDDFEKQLLQMTSSGKQDLEPQTEWVSENLLLSDVNVQRQEIFEGLFA